jgi:hypothetical protein
MRQMRHARDAAARGGVLRLQTVSATRLACDGELMAGLTVFLAFSSRSELDILDRLQLPAFEASALVSVAVVNQAAVLKRLGERLLRSGVFFAAYEFEQPSLVISEQRGRGGEGFRLLFRPFVEPVGDVILLMEIVG